MSDIWKAFVVGLIAAWVCRIVFVIFDSWVIGIVVWALFALPIFVYIEKLNDRDKKRTL